MERHFRIALLALLLSGCGSTPLSRWASMTVSPTPQPIADENGNLSPDYDPVFAVDSMPTPADLVTNASTASKPLTIKDLSDRGQSSLIQALAKLEAGESASCLSGNSPKGCAGQALIQSLGLAASKSAQDNGSAVNYVDQTSFKRTIVVNVLNAEALPPGDRLQKFTVTIKPDNVAAFSNYTIAATQYSNSKIGSITQTTEFDLSGKLDPKFGGSLVGTGEADAAYSNKLQSQADIAEAIMLLNVNVDSGQLIVQKTGGQSLEITGNTLIAVSISVSPAYTFPALVVVKENLVDGTTPIGSDKAGVTLNYTIFPDDSADITGTASLDFMLRHINAGAGTYSEGDDDVTFFRGKISADAGTGNGVVLIPKADLVGRKFLVVASYKNSGGSCALEATPIGFGPDHFPLYFTSPVDADLFAWWLNQTHASTLNKGQLSLLLNGAPIPWKEIYDFAVVDRRIIDNPKNSLAATNCTSA